MEHTAPELLQTNKRVADRVVPIIFPSRHRVIDFLITFAKVSDGPAPGPRPQKRRFQDTSMLYKPQEYQYTAVSNFILTKTTDHALCTAISLVRRSRRRHSSRYVITRIQGPNKLVRGGIYSRGALVDRSLIAVGARSSKRPGIRTFHFYAGNGPAAHSADFKIPRCPRSPNAINTLP